MTGMLSSPRSSFLVLLALLLACGGDEPAPAPGSGDGPVVTPARTARVASVKGSVEDADGKVLSVNDALVEGDEVRLAAGAAVELAFADDATLHATGPARFSLELLSGSARTIVLEKGAIDRLEIREVVTGVKTPLDAFVAGRKAAVSVALSAMEKEDRAVFTLLGEGEAKVVDGSARTVLEPGAPHTVTRPKSR